MKKECKIILLSTKEASNIHLEDGGILILYKEARIYSNTTPQHLFVLSDDKIKESDWISCPTGIIVFTKALKGENFKGWKKIIATTNPKLLIGEFIDDGSQSGFGFYKDTVASISQSDIEYIINLYNKKGKETNVERLAEERALFHYPEYANDPDNYESRERIKIGFIDGYNKSLQDNADKKFTLEDIRSVVRKSIYLKGGLDKEGFSFYKDDNEIMDECIQSLTEKQSKNDTVMVEYEKYNEGFTPDISFYKPKLKDDHIIIHQ